MQNKCKIKNFNLNNFVTTSDELKYFSKLTYCDEILLEEDKPDVGSILSSSLDCSIENIKLIDTPVSLSFEGQNLSGSKLLVTLRLKQKITYLNTSYTQSIFSLIDDSSVKSVFIVVPSVVDDRNICDLVRNNKFIVSPITEYSDVKIHDCRTLYSNVSLIVSVSFLGSSSC